MISRLTSDFKVKTSQCTVGMDTYLKYKSKDIRQKEIQNQIFDIIIENELEDQNWYSKNKYLTSWIDNEHEEQFCKKMHQWIELIFCPVSICGAYHYANRDDEFYGDITTYKWQ